MHLHIEGIILSDEVQHDGSGLLVSCSYEQPPVVT
jgi:hypothetical protein